MLKSILYTPAVVLGLAGAYVGYDHHFMAAVAGGFVGFRAISKRVGKWVDKNENNYSQGWNS